MNSLALFLVIVLLSYPKLSKSLDEKSHDVKLQEKLHYVVKLELLCWYMESKNLQHFLRILLCYECINFKTQNPPFFYLLLKSLENYKFSMTAAYFCKLYSRPLSISFQSAALASSSVSTKCPSSNDILWMLNCRPRKEVKLHPPYGGRTEKELMQLR